MNWSRRSWPSAASLESFCALQASLQSNAPRSGCCCCCSGRTSEESFGAGDEAVPVSQLPVELSVAIDGGVG